MLLACIMMPGLTVSCDEGTGMRFDQAQYAAAAGDPVQLKFVAEERKSQGCMPIAPEVNVIDQTSYVDSWNVEPSDGASVDSSGRFTATEPGDYTVSATFSGTTYTTKVTVDDTGGATAEEPEEVEPEEECPPLEALAGDWSWTGALESNGVLGPGTNVYTYTFRQEGTVVGARSVGVQSTRPRRAPR